MVWDSKHVLLCDLSLTLSLRYFIVISLTDYAKVACHLRQYFLNSQTTMLQRELYNNARDIIS